MNKATLGIISANYKKNELGELVNARTVATVPFGGRYRLVDFPLSNLVNSNIKTVGLITPYYYRSIMDHLEAGKPWELARKIGGLFILPGTVYGYREEGSRFLLRDIIINRKIIDRSHSKYVLFCDTSTVMNCDFNELIDAHAASGAEVTLMYKKESGRENRSYLKLDKNGRVKELIDNGEKEKNLFIGCFIINRDFLIKFMDWYKTIENNDIVYILSQNIDKYNIHAFEYKGYCAVIDSISDYMKASTELLDRNVRKELFDQDRVIFTKIQDEAPTIYRPGSKVKKSMVAAGCVIEGTVENCIVFRSVTIKKGAVVKNSILMQKATIEANATVINAILDKYTKVNSNTRIEGSNENPIVIGKDQNI